MQRHARERGAALILLLGIVATLAILATTLVMVIINQQAATAHERARKTSAYYAEAALESAVQVAKGKTISTTAEWLTPADLAAAFSTASFPAGATVTYRVYDNLATVVYATKWDSNGDGMVWVEVTVTYLGKTTRMRVLVRRTQQNLVTALPKAVLYSDTGILASGSSDLYALNPDGTPDTSGTPYPTSLMAGRGFTYNSSTDLAAPNTTEQSLALRVNTTVTPSGTSRTFKDVVARAGTVGLLSDYFDQAAQADLGDEAQVGATHAAAPLAPVASGSTVTASKFSQANILTIPGASYNAGTKTYTFTGALIVSDSLTLKSGTGTGAGVFPNDTKFSFASLYMNGSSALTLTDRVSMATTSLRVGGTLKVNNTTTTSVTDQFGPLYVGGVLSVSGQVTFNTLLSGIAQSLYVGGAATITGPSSTVIDQFGLVYAAGALSLVSDVQVQSTALVVNGDLTISGADSAIIDQFGPIYVGGAARLSGTVSVKTTNYLNAAAAPGAMWIGTIFSHTWPSTGGTWRYNDVYGDTWISGNAGTSNVAINYTGPTSGTSPCTVMCKLMATTEKTTTSGRVDFGTRLNPMTYYMMCDNDGLYSNTCEWGSSGKFCGLMVVMEACIKITGGDGTQPCVEGAIFCGTPYVSGSSDSTNDIALSGSASVAYNQSIIDKVANASIVTTTTSVTTVPGSWQQLSAN